jgi:hypothetical protein
MNAYVVPVNPVNTTPVKLSVFEIQLDVFAAS